MSNSEFLEKLMNFDSIDFAERLCDNKEEATSLGMLMHMQVGEMKRQLLAGFDTHYGCSYQEAYKMITDMGFVPVFNMKFERKVDNDEIIEEDFTAFRHPEYTMFIRLEEYHGRINTLNVYALLNVEYKNGKITEEFMDAVLHMSRDSFSSRNMFGFYTHKKEIMIDLDGREGFRLRMAKLKKYISNKKFSSKPNHIFWLKHFSEKYDEAINMNRVRIVLGDKIWNERKEAFKIWFYDNISSKMWSLKYKITSPFRFYKIKRRFKSK